MTDWLDQISVDPPTTAMLTGTLDRAARVVIAETNPQAFRGREEYGAGRDAVPHTVLTSPAEIAELARLLTIVDGGTGDRCRCLGWPTIQVLDGDGAEIALWTLHHQNGIRGLGDCDADLVDGPALTEWLAERGLTGSKRVQTELAAQRDLEERRRQEWVAAAPDGVADVAEAVSWRRDGAEAELARRLVERFPDEVERIRALIGWAGFPGRRAGGTPWAELAPRRLLLAESPETVLTALAAVPLGPAQLDGAAELVTALEWPKDVELPDWLVDELVAHVTANGTEPMRFRMRHGYGKGKEEGNGAEGSDHAAG